MGRGKEGGREISKGVGGGGEGELRVCFKGWFVHFFFMSPFFSFSLSPYFPLHFSLLLFFCFVFIFYFADAWIGYAWGDYIVFFSSFSFFIPYPFKGGNIERNENNMYMEKGGIVMLWLILSFAKETLLFVFYFLVSLSPSYKQMLDIMTSPL